MRAVHKRERMLWQLRERAAAFAPVFPPPFMGGLTKALSGHM